MMLMAINDGGKLLLSDGTPLDAETLSLVFNMEEEELKTALKLFEKTNLIEIKDGVIKITDFDDMVGSECDSAQRVRKSREKSKALHCNIEKDKDIDIDKDKDIDIEKEREKTAAHTENGAPTDKKTVFSENDFIIPCFEEVVSYATERGSSVDAEKFYDHYSAVGWKMGNAQIKDWKAAFRKWERTERSSAFSPPATSSPAAFKNASQSSKMQGKNHPFKSNFSEGPFVVEKSASFNVDDYFEAALARVQIESDKS